MSAQYHFVTADRQDRDMYVRERVLNSSIIAADLRGKDHVRALLFNFLAPLHVMAEMGVLSIQVRESPLHGDTARQVHTI